MMSQLPPFFPQEEYQTRLRNVREKMSERDIDACLITTPENIYYLIGLSHQGFFAYHGLIVPRDGPLHLITRAMERVTIENQVHQVEFVGHTDSEDPAHVTLATLKKMGLGLARLGLEKKSLFLPPRIAETLQSQASKADWVDISGVVDSLRLIKSNREMAYTRQAAKVSDAMMQTAIATARTGVSEKEISAEVHRAMILAGGDYPGFGPFIRSSRRLGEEHTTWTDDVLRSGDGLFLELTGCVARYHAPMGRLVFIDKAPPHTETMAAICIESFYRAVAALQPGTTASQVYQAWQSRVDEAGLAHYRRHHCGYLVGIGFPPSWVGGSRVVGLRHDSSLEIQVGMTFHLLSWLMGARAG